VTAFTCSVKAHSRATTNALVRAFTRSVKAHSRATTNALVRAFTRQVKARNRACAADSLHALGEGAECCRAPRATAASVTSGRTWKPAEGPRKSLLEKDDESVVRGVRCDPTGQLNRTGLDLLRNVPVASEG
jgi:hypothetical protein